MLGVAQAVELLLGVVKRHVEMYTVLNNKTALIELKAIGSCTVLEELISFTEVPGIQSVLFAHALKDFHNIQQNLNSVLGQVEKSGPVVRFLEAPVLCKSLEETD